MEHYIIQLIHLVDSRFSQIIQVYIGFQEEIELEFIFPCHLNTFQIAKSYV